jgi:hypothetical protein
MELSNGKHHAKLTGRILELTNESTSDRITLILKDDAEARNLLDVIFNRD